MYNQAFYASESCGNVLYITSAKTCCNTREYMVNPVSCDMKNAEGTFSLFKITSIMDRRLL